MNKERILLVVSLSLVFIISLSFVFAVSAAKIDGVVKFRGYQYFAYSDGERSEIYIGKDKSVYLQRPSFGGILTDYFIFDKKMGIVSADPAGNFILLDSSLSSLIGEELFAQIEGREINENGLVGEQADSIELTINTNGMAIPTGIVADGRGYLRAKSNLKETVGTIDKTGNIKMYNPSSYSSSSKTSLTSIANQIHNTKASDGVITNLKKVSTGGYAIRNANRTPSGSVAKTITQRIRESANKIVDRVTGRTPSTREPGTPRTGTPGTKPTPSPKPGPTPKPSPGTGVQKCSIGATIQCGCVIPPKSADAQKAYAECNSVQFVGISYWECIASGKTSKWSKISDDCPKGTVGGWSCKEGSDCYGPGVEKCDKLVDGVKKYGTHKCVQSGNVCKWGECELNDAGRCEEPTGAKDSKRRIDCEDNKQKTYYAQCICDDNKKGSCSWKAVDEKQKIKDCAECEKSSECKDSKKPICDIEYYKCFKCNWDNECKTKDSKTPICDTNTGQCVEKCTPAKKKK